MVPTSPCTHEHTTCWTRIRTVDGLLQETFEDAARAIGLVHGVEEYTICLQEGIGFSTAKELRQLFTALFLHGAPACALWEIFQDDLAADFASNLPQSAAVNAALKSIDLMLHKHGRSTDKYGLPKVHHENTEYDSLRGAFGRQEMQELADQLIPKLTQEQKTVFDAITSSVIQEASVYTIDAPAGTCTTFTETTIAASLRARGTLVLCTAFSGIAALIFPGGLTAHSTFKLPFGPDAFSGSTCNMKAVSKS